MPFTQLLCARLKKIPRQQFMIQQKLKLSPELKTLLKNCDEIWIAVAMVSDRGFDFIQSNINENAKQNYLIGVGLPTSPRVLEKLKDLNQSSNFLTKIYHKPNELFHPKVYVIRHEETLISLVGSGNCTIGGFENNIEVSVKTDDQTFCNGQLKWFNALFKHSKSITDDFLNSYRLLFEKRKERMKKDRKEIEMIFSQENSNTNLDEIDFENQFFKKEHFDAFSHPKPWDYSDKTNQERKSVRNKLYKLNDLILPKIKEKKWDIHEHYSFDDIVSSAVHGHYTSDELGGIWLHYGRNKNAIKAYGNDQTPLDYMRLQVIIHNDNIGIWNRIGKDNGSRIDRDNLKQKLKTDENYRKLLFGSLNKLPSGYFIRLNDEKRFVNEFENEGQLTEFLLLDDYRYYFIIGIEYAPNNPKLSETKIADTVITDFGLLYPTYKMIKHNLGY